MKKASKKIIPDVVKSLLSKLAYPFNYSATGLSGYRSGFREGLDLVALTGIYDFNPAICVSFWGRFLRKFLVMFGFLTGGLQPPAILESVGPGVILVASIAICFAQAGALINIMMRTKEDKVRQLRFRPLYQLFLVTGASYLRITLLCACRLSHLYFWH